MAGPGDEIAAGAGGRGRLRASRADRERVIGILKAAFVQGMLAKDEFDQRVSQTFAARTHAELDALTADLPAGLVAAQPTRPARAQHEPMPMQRPGRWIMVATALYAGVWPFTFLLPWPTNSEGDSPAAIILLFFFTSSIYLCFSTVAVVLMIAGWREKRSGGRPPRRPARGAGGQASRRLPPAGPGQALPPAGHGHRHAAEAARNRRPCQRRACAEAVLRAS
jgi:hypothetical protein